MNHVKFENNYYEEILDYAQKYIKIKEDGYYKVDLIEKMIRFKHNKII